MFYFFTCSIEDNYGNLKYNTASDYGGTVCPKAYAKNK
jgi:hypothetical protein